MHAIHTIVESSAHFSSNITGVARRDEPPEARDQSSGARGLLCGDGGIVAQDVGRRPDAHPGE
jgi:hypothetical protein